jgi:hypothetical protein
MLDPMTCQTPDPLPLIDGGERFDNVFLGQTIALSLNVRLDDTLPTFVLPEGPFCTEPLPPAGEAAVVETFEIPTEVLDALQTLGLPNTVGGLLQLANLALAGEPTAGASLSQINWAVSVINQAFDGCRVVVGCPIDAVAGFVGGVMVENESDRTATPFGAPTGSLAGPEVPLAFELGEAYPNPFNPSTRIRLGLAHATDWTLTIYDTTGRLVNRFRGYSGGAEYVEVHWDGTNLQGAQVGAGVYFYRLVAGEFAATRRAILMK